MAYFGGGGVVGLLHPSLRVYIDCFLSPPFPKMFPRGGGIWDQDPTLVRDFRFIRDFELQWKDAQRQQSELSGAENTQGGGDFDLEDALNELLEDGGLEEGDLF